MSQDQEGDIIQGRMQTPEEIDLTEWARASKREELKSISDSLRGMVVLSTALLAGSATVMKEVPGPVGLKATGAVLLMAALCVSMFGSMPNSHKLRVGGYDEIRAARERTASRRLLLLMIAGVGVAGGLGCVVLGALVAACRG